jgi:curved DNA-binding protein
MEYKDYYQSLGVAKDADNDAIKRAYRKLARQFHPDMNPGDKKAEERFKEVNEAYEVLSDADKRQKYDQFGSQWQQYSRAGGRPEDFWQQWGGGRAGAPGGGQGRTVTPEEFEQLFGQGGMGGSGFSNFFEMLFGQMGGQPGRSSGFGGQQPFGGRRPAARPPVEHKIEITLEEAFSGATRMLQWSDGRQIEAKIPAGVKTGSKVRLRDQVAGDIMLKVEVLPHAQFQREGDNLRVNVPVDLYTAVLGGEITVPTLERALILTVPPETANGKQFRLRGKGMPHLRHPDQRGDLIATVAIQLPANLTDEEKELFTQLRQLRQSR